VLDLCSAPGGKTCAIAQWMSNEGKLVAHDHDAKRLERVRENCDRLGVRNVELTSGIHKLEGEVFDRVLVDAPCSNSGVMRRRVDLRWRMSEPELARLVKEQMDLLMFGARVVKSGGVIVYSTCSIEPEENSGVVRKFLEQHKDRFTLEGERELLPFREGVDGAYAALLKRAP
jgi:16S rRNA (cytosine967-C5)-methyltransferase